jgi:hypothetical protein
VPPASIRAPVLRPAARRASVCINMRERAREWGQPRFTDWVTSGSVDDRRDVAYAREAFYEVSEGAILAEPVGEAHGVLCDEGRMGCSGELVPRGRCPESWIGASTLYLLYGLGTT